MTLTENYYKQRWISFLGVLLVLMLCQGAADGSTKGSKMRQVEQRDNDEVWDVIIVGAGQAGMAAAHRLVFEHELSDEPLRVLILEASDHVGGRTRNYDVQTQQNDTISDNVIELGGTWLSPEHTATLKFCKEHLGLEIFQASRPEKEIKQVSNLRTSTQDEASYPWWFLGPDYLDEEMLQMKRVVYHHTGANYTIETSVFSTPEEFLAIFSSETVEQLKAVGDIIDEDAEALIDNPSKTGSVNIWELPLIGKEWHRFDSASTAEDRSFLSVSHNSSRKSPLLTDPDARNILRGLVHDKNAEDPHKVSYLYNLISWQGANSAGPDMEYRVRGGTQAIPLTIAKKLEDSRNAQLRLKSPVKSISRLEKLGDGDSRFQITVAGGEVYQAKTILITGSPSTLRKIDFGSLVPDAQRQLLSPESSPMGRCHKVCAVYKRGPWWREQDLQGDVLASKLPESMSVHMSWKDGQTESMPLFPYCFDVSPHSGDYGVLACFVEGAAYDRIHGMTEDQLKETFTEFLKLSFESFLDDDGETLWHPDEIISSDWGPGTEYIGGAYSSYFPPRILTRIGIWEAYQSIEKAPNVFLAGADYHAGFGNGYIEGAVRSGQLAANKIRERLLDNKNVQ